MALLAAALLSSAFPQAGLSQENPVQEAIQNEVQQLEQAGALKIRNENIDSIKLLPAFYEKRGFSPAWTNEAAGDQLIEAIKSIDQDGLNPADYHLDLIESLRSGSKADAPAQNTADLDLVMTDAALTLGSHLLYGKLDPQCLFNAWHIHETDSKIDPAEEVQEAIDSVKLNELYDSFRAKHMDYFELKKALASYRAIAAKGGWDPIPYGPTLEPGDSSSRMPAIRKRLAATGDLAAQSDSNMSQSYDGKTVEAVKHFQLRHMLRPDGVLTPQTLESMNTTVEQRIDQILVNLERARWIIKPGDETTVTVNIAGFKLYYSGPNDSYWETKVVVGRPYRKTPVFISRINRLVLNPTWTVPPTILKKDLLPKIKRSPGYLRIHKFRVLRGSPLTIQQIPGPWNPLGRVKFLFPNPFEVYLHDTSEKKLFNRLNRTASSGCIRVQNALHLADLLLSPQGVTHKRISRMLRSRKTVTIHLKQPVLVFVLYWTVEVQPDGSVMFMPDIYKRDSAVLDGLKGRLTDCDN